MQFLMNFNKVFSRPNEKKLGLTKGDKGSQVFLYISFYLALKQYSLVLKHEKCVKLALFR